MCNLRDVETLIGEAGDYARLISLAMQDDSNRCDADKQAISRAALRIEELAKNALQRLDETRHPD